jgi:2-alkyl-3-oxoalkanoate reductase
LQRLGALPVEVDLFDLASVRRAVAGHDAIVNLATSIPGSAAKMMMPWQWRENDRVRTIGSANVVDAAIAESVPRVVQESFAPIYAENGDDWIDEDWPVRPVKYNRSTMDAEASIQRFNQAGGTGLVLRFAGFYGPDPLLGAMLDVIRRGWSPLPGDPRAFASFISQDDAASAVVAAIDLPAGIYNVAEDEPMRRGEWVNSLADAARLRRPRPLPAWLSRYGGSLMDLLSRSQRISNRKLRRASGWVPKYANAKQAWPDVLRDLAQETLK